MAIIWKKVIKDRCYEVRMAGNSLRLYTNGTFHSQYNSRSPLNGSLWDLLVLPALFRPKNIKRVLVLGLGGGAVVRQILDLVDRPNIIAVELDPTHVYIANKYFSLARMNEVEIVTADAIAWLKHYKGKPFDLIVDDLFVENGNDPFRAVEVDDAWSALLVKNLTKNGTVVVNFESTRAMNMSAFLKSSGLEGKIKSGFSFSTPGYANKIAAFFRQVNDKALLNETLKSFEEKRGRRFTRKINAIIKKII
ncbi:hypothetical protein NBRC116493_35740 [Aurantivibrio infirmus]